MGWETAGSSVMVKITPELQAEEMQAIYEVSAKAAQESGTVWLEQRKITGA